MIWSVLTKFFKKNNITKASLQDHKESSEHNVIGSTAPAAHECAVCLSSLVGKSSTRVLPCGHEYHGVCIDRWLAVPCVKTCPICRFSMDDYKEGSVDGDQKCVIRQEWFTDEMVIWFSSFHVAGF